MPVPKRPSGPISPVDLLWRHELKEQNAALLRRMNALEAKCEDQERRTKKAEEAATTCADVVKQLDCMKSNIDHLEKKVQELMGPVYKRFADIEKDIDTFKKMQERVAKLRTDFRALENRVEDHPPLEPRLDSLEREMQGLKRSAGEKHDHEIEDLDSRLEKLEGQRSREDVRIRNLQDSFAEKYDDKIQALQAEVAKMKTIQRVPSDRASVQVPRSPEVGPSSPTVTGAALHRAKRRTPQKQGARQQPLQEQQGVNRETETRGTTQTSTQVEEVVGLDLDTSFVAQKTPLPKRGAPQTGMSPRKKPKVSHAKTKQHVDHVDPPSVPNPEPRSSPSKSIRLVVDPIPPLMPSPSKIIRLRVDQTKKRPESPISASRPTNKSPLPPVQQQQPVQGSERPRQHTLQKDAQPTRSARKGLRGRAPTTFLQLDYNLAPQPQTQGRPVYDISAPAQKPLKTKPRRRPPGIEK